MADRPEDPTQRMPEASQGADDEARRILEQQHTGNHQKPGAESGAADRRGGTRAGAETVEDTSRPGPGRDASG